MTVPGNLSSPLLATAAAAGAAGGIATKSLRFNSADSSHLSRTPSSAGNRKTFTVSCWVKRAALSAHNHLLQTGDNYFRFQNSDEVIFYSSGSDAVYTTAKFRDVSAWYHVVLAVDTTQSTAANRVKIYVNGTQHTLTGTQPSQNADLAINNTAVHYIGSAGTSSSEALNGYLADYYLIDGSQLDPTSFGAYDNNGVWQAAEYSGTFGTNGFHLNFSDASSIAALGTDSSGNSNTFTVNNLVHAGGVAGTGARSAAVVFDGTDDSISFTNNSDLDPGNGTFTLECFVYKQPGQQVVVYYGTGVGQAGFRVLGNSKLGVERINQAFDLQTGNTVPENQWVHIAWVKSGTTIQGYINGQSAGSATTSQNYTGTFVTAKTLGSGDFNNMVISDLHLVKGTALYTTSSFTPPTTISAHANTKLLCFQNASSATTATVKPSGVTLTASSSPTAGPYPMTANADIDVLFDVPTNGDASDETGAGGEVSGNYATLNPLQTGSSLTLSNGSLALDGHSSWRSSYSTIFLPSGKWYFEVTIRSITTHSYGILVGLAGLGTNIIESEISSGDSYAVQNGPGNMKVSYNSGSTDLGSQSAYAVGDVLQLAYDADNGKLWFGKNGTYINSGNPSAGSNEIKSGISGTYCFAVALLTTSDKIDCNFGQRAWAYSAPTNFEAVCTTNLPTPAIAKGSDHFDTKLYTGNGGTQTISGYGFSPDIVWLKMRSGNNDTWHVLADIIRGNEALFPNDDNAAIAGYVNGFTSDGFGVQVSPNDTANSNNNPYVAWAWDVGSSTATNTDGSITTSVRVNQTCGISIATYSYDNSNGNQTLGHGLGVIPDLVIRKDRNIGDDWSVYSKAVGFTQRAHLEQSSAFSGTSTFGNASATSSVNRANNMNNGNYVDYSFVSIPGFSLISTYTGNGSSDGVFVHCGFRPAFLLTKRTNGTAFWAIVDSTRDPDNVMSKLIYPNASNAEGNSDVVDFLSNGFKIRSTSNEFNTAAPYLFYAVAENPFQANGGLAR